MLPGLKSSRYFFELDIERRFKKDPKFENIDAPAGMISRCVLSGARTKGT